MKVSKEAKSCFDYTTTNIVDEMKRMTTPGGCFKQELNCEGASYFVSEAESATEPTQKSFAFVPKFTEHPQA